MEEKSPDTLARIQQAALEEFSEKGFLGASLRQIVKNAGVTTGAFYGYFSSKEALFAAIVEPHAAALMGRFMEAQTGFAELPEEDQPEHMGEASSDYVDWMVDYICDHREPVKLLLWNLLVVAQSDSCYQEEEAKLIRYIARHLEIDKSIVPEMEHALRAMLAIENEMEWLKSTDRPFGTVEPVLTELAERKATIVQAVHDLIGD